MKFGPSRLNAGAEAPQCSYWPGGEATRRKIAKRILPFLFISYFIAYLDRANVAFAYAPMTRELGFSDAVYGLGTGLFFLGYFFLEIPSAVMVERFGARRWIARIMITWGVVTVLFAFERTAAQFYSLRLLLGLAEAGFFPGVIVYLTHWFPREDRMTALSGFAVAASRFARHRRPGILRHSADPSDGY